MNNPFTVRKWQELQAKAKALLHALPEIILIQNKRWVRMIIMVSMGVLAIALIGQLVLREPEQSKTAKQELVEINVEQIARIKTWTENRRDQRQRQLSVPGQSLFVGF